ncbi:hypothetical protein [Microbacterium sp. Leaf179]|uniref:hypothetical protein n=1 Tax=Microbacterium sp. Leaf179 TaxID=1736288 RepID=UPI0006F3FDF3|nr:hypothetical protein [Microbacterium sp. Leaf179]KQR86734.1 hypothetical protein ASF96_10460 [Microbacterium sp. Leaf179]
MTDSRLPGRWLTDITFEQLSDRAWRSFCGSLMWSNEQGTDGVVPDAAMKYLHPHGVDAPTRAELIAAGLWRNTKVGITVPDWASKMGQSGSQDLADKREQNRERQRRHREKTRAKVDPVTRDVTRDVTRESLGKDRTGEERPGKDIAEGLDERTGEVVEWPTRRPGDPDGWVETAPGEWTEAS